MARPDTAASPPPVVHWAAPRAATVAAMVFVLACSAPAYVVAPERALSAGGVAGLIVLGAFELLLASIALRRVVVSVDPRGETLSLVSHRWPLATRSEAVPVADVRDVILQKAPRSPAVRIALVLGEARQLPITRSFFGNSRRMDRDAEEIRRLLERRPGE